MSVFQTVGGVAECHIYKKIHFVGSKQLFCKHLKMAINDCVLLVNVNLYYLQCHKVYLDFLICCMWVFAAIVIYRINAEDFVNELVQCIRRLMPDLDSLLSAHREILCLIRKYSNLHTTRQSSLTEWHGIASVRLLVFCDWCWHVQLLYKSMGFCIPSPSSSSNCKKTAGFGILEMHEPECRIVPGNIRHCWLYWQFM